MQSSWRDRLRREPPSQFVYKKLGDDQVRLLYLVSNRHNSDQLHVRLIHREDPPKYQALSYVWGNPTEAPLPEILCSYEWSRPAPMRITPNLHAALTAIRPSRRMLLWADAICINQADNGQEKQEQVRRMDEIYRWAQEVIIWFHPSVNWQHEPPRRPLNEDIYFGPVPDGTEVAIELCRWLAAYLEDENVTFNGFPSLLRRFDTSSDDMVGRPSFTPKQVRRLGHLLKENSSYRGQYTPENVADLGLPSYYDRIWTYLYQLLTHVWFTRTWTVQEVMLAKKATVRSADCHISWTSLIEVLDSSSFCLSISLPGVEIQAESEGRRYAKQTFLTPFFSSPATMKGWDIWFMSLLIELRARDVTEPVDRVYGVLALASQNLRAQIPIDYSEAARKQYWHLYIHIAHIAVASGHAFQILRGPSPIDRLPELPSWCPNFNVVGLSNEESWPSGMAGFFDSRTTRIIRSSPSPALIRLGGFSVDTVKLVLEDPTFEWCYDRRRLQGPEGMIVRNLRWLRQIKQIVRDSVLDSGMVPSIFWQVLLGYIPPAPDGTKMIDHPGCSQEKFALFILYLDRMDADPDAMARNIFDKEQHRLYDEVWDLATALFNGRRFFVTEKGHFGWGNVGTKAGDNVCVFLGEKVLYILTPPETKTVKGRFDTYRDFRSPAYVQGMMMGEYLKDVKEGEHEIFNII